METLQSAQTNKAQRTGSSLKWLVLLIVVNFQSWLDPFIIVTALPSALAGIILALFVTHTRLSVPALMGSIMCMGVATANSILVISFAKEKLKEHGNPVQAAIEAGVTRFRPVLMTAFAMIIGIPIIFWIAWRAWRGDFGPGYHTPVELTGLYWHFVDIIWIFLFPALYLL